METTRREMMFMVGAAGAVVATSATLRLVAQTPAFSPTIVAETSAILRVPVDVMEGLGLSLPVMDYTVPDPVDKDADAHHHNRGWYRDVKFRVVGLDHVEDPDDRALYKRMAFGASAWPGVTVPRTPIEASGKRITDVNYDVLERAAYVTYRLWAAPVAVTKMVFHGGTHGLEMDVFYHTVEIEPGDFKDPFAKAQ